MPTARTRYEVKLECGHFAAVLAPRSIAPQDVAMVLAYDWEGKGSPLKQTMKPDPFCLRAGKLAWLFYALLEYRHEQ